MAATNEQIQKWSDERTRARAHQLRALLLSIEDDIAAFDAVYAALNDSPTWTDGRTDAPPNLLGPNDLLGVNALLVAVKNMIRAHDQLPIALKACVHSVLQ